LISYYIYLVVFPLAEEHYNRSEELEKSIAMDSIAAFEIAMKAVEKLVVREGQTAKFPFDKIWDYVDPEDEFVPSTLRPGQRGRLLKKGYIELTGKMTNASSSSRAGSATPEYQPGKYFRSDSRPSLFEPKPVTEALKNIEKAMADEGFIVTTPQLANFYLAIKTSPLVILAGTSGTGKSKLPRLFAKLVGANFTSINVQPQWSDNADLFGYTPSLAPETFIEGKFTQAVIRAFNSAEKPAIVLLDEMNLAAVEHYFSDFLSVVETRRKEDGIILTDPLPLDLPSPKDPDPFEPLRKLYLPPNMRVVGTANMDETTHVFSPKVLDRAFSIEFGEVDLTAFESYVEKKASEENLSWLGDILVGKDENPISVSEVYDESRDLFDHIAGLAEEIKDILKPGGISFGYRTRDAMCLYMWHWKKDKLAEILPLQDALDLCILQKILPKISGTGEGLRQALKNLHEWLLQTGTTKEIAQVLPGEEVGENPEAFSDEEISSEIETTSNNPYQRSVEKVARMLQKLSDEGAVTYWGA
jgi:hypothetical protein